MQLVRAHSERGLHDEVRLADELHVSVLDAVVHHFHIVPRAVVADVRAARIAVDLSRDRGKDRLHERIRFPLASGHDCRAVPSAFLASAHAGADVEDALLGKRLVAPNGVLEERVAAVDDEVPRLEVRNQLVDEVVDRIARFDHEHDLAGPAERGYELVQGVACHNVSARSLTGHELLSAGRSTVEHRDREAFV